MEPVTESLTSDMEHKARKGVLAGQVAIITGAAGGLGASMVAAMAGAGASVVVNYFGNPELADKLVQTLEAAGGTAVAIAADVSKPDDVDELFRKTVKLYGTVDILVANAGVQRDAKFVDMSIADWQGAIDIDLTGQFLCMQAAAREFIRRGVVDGVSKAAGKIISITSVHTVIPWAGHVNYAAAKGGAEMLMKSVAQELAPHRIRVNGIAPGAIRTPINKSVWDDPAKYIDLLKLIPYARIGEPDDVAHAAVWLASDEADYVTGTTLFVDGGMTLYAAFADNG